LELSYISMTYWLLTKGDLVFYVLYDVELNILSQSWSWPSEQQDL